MSVHQKPFSADPGLSAAALAHSSRYLAKSLFGSAARIGGLNPYQNSMNLIDSMKIAASHLQKAARQANDWRVRNAVADAATMVQCAIFIEQKIAAGQMSPQFHAPGMPGASEPKT